MRCKTATDLFADQARTAQLSSPCPRKGFRTVPRLFFLVRAASERILSDRGNFKRKTKIARASLSTRILSIRI
jgi:hypothetical protein